MQTFSDKARFVLKEPTSNKPTLILLLYRYQNERLKYSTGETIHPDQWDAATQQARTDQKNKKDREFYQAINAQLARHRSTVKRGVAQLTLAEVAPTVDQLRAYLDKEFKKEPTALKKGQERPVTFFAFTEQFIEDCKTGKQLTSTNRRYSIGTIKNFRMTVNHLLKFQTVYPSRLDFDAFNMTFYERFKKHLTTANYSVNAIGNLIKMLKIMLKRAYRDGLHTNDIFRHEDFKKMQEEVETIYLTETDLQKLYDANLSEHPRLDTLRDTFLIGCYTGLRFSDFMQLRPQNIIHDGQILSVLTQKTGTRVSIPLNPKVLAILSKYNNQTPRVLSNQKFNDYLKELAKVAGLTDLVQTARTKGGMRMTRTAEKWELVTTHTARRSFATNAYKGGVPTIDIMKMTGHKTETSFMKYIKVSGEETAIRLLGHSYFQGSALKIAR
ncbi:site-specific integrase [Spirosoma arcticum]